MRILMLALLTLCACNKDRIISSPPVCDQTCYTGQKVNAGIGICTLGIWTCVEGTEPVCIGSVTPATQECNGLDNDCDGLVDSAVELCTNSCGAGVRYCTGGVTSQCLGKSGSPEVCNNKDDDCDGIIDNLVFTSSTSAICYAGSDGTLGHGPCRPGVRSCEDGHERCIGEILPQIEVCNHIDDDCDGTVDDGTAIKSKDIVLCIDNSGSMEPYITGIKSVTKKWASKYTGRLDLRWALMECPGWSVIYERRVTLVQNFTDVSTFNVAIAKEAAGNTGQEPTIDAVYLSAIPSNPLMLNWRAGADKTLIVFSDEIAQTYMVIPGDGGLVDLTTNDAAEAAVAANMRVYIFTKPEFNTSYQPMDSRSGGRLIDIGLPASRLEAELDSIIDICK